MKIDFTQIEYIGKHLFEQFPAVKRGLKRIYQLTSYALSNEKFKAEGELNRVTPDDGYEYFYGYYDKSPWDATDRYMLALRVKQSYKSVAPEEPGIIVLIDTKKDNKVYKIAMTHSWNVQQGCMLQWLGPDFHSRIIYNDFRDSKYCSVIYNLKTKKEEKVLPMPVYDVAKDGSFALTLDFSRLHRLRPGYGYSNLPDSTKGELCPDKPCIWKIDLESGEVEELFKYTDFAFFEPDPSMDGAEHKVNHIMISPNGKRFMVLHRWLQKGRKHTRLVTVNVDGTQMYNLSDDVFVSHSYWKNDEEILSFLRKEETGDHYYLLKDKTQEYKMLWQELNTDGHCSYSPDRKYVITDTYPNRKRLASLYLCTEDDDKARCIAKVFSPFRYDNDTRCDLHPRWNREGDQICIDSVHDGKRGMYVINIPLCNKESITIKEKVKFPQNGIKIGDDTSVDGKYKIVYLVTRLRRSGPVCQTLDLVRNLNPDLFTSIIVSLYPENSSDSMLEDFLSIGVKYYCVGMSRIESIIWPKRKMTPFLVNLEPDLIHSVGMPLYRIARKYDNFANFTTIHNYIFEDYPVKYGIILGECMAYRDIFLISKESYKMVTCSESLSKLYMGKRKIQIDYIRNGIDATRFIGDCSTDKSVLRKSLNLPIDKKIAVFTGQVCARKNQKFAIKGIINSNREDVCLVVLGDGPDFKKLTEEYKNYSNIIFRGKVNNVREYLCASDFYISSSVSEGLPVSVLEAMAAGLPLMLSDIIQHKEIFDMDENLGVMFKNTSLSSFDNALNILLDMNLDSVGKNCRRVIDTKLSAKNMTQCYEKKYLNLIDDYQTNKRT